MINAETVLRQVLRDAIAYGSLHQDTTDQERHVEALVCRLKQLTEQPLDGKFSGLVWRNRDGKVEEQFVVFVPRDDALVTTLGDYQRHCQNLGCGEEQLKSVTCLMARVLQWRVDNIHETKLPDAEPGE